MKEYRTPHISIALAGTLESDGRNKSIRALRTQNWPESRYSILTSASDNFDYLAFYDDRDFLLPFKLESQTRFMEETPKVDIAISDAYLTNVYGHVFDFFRWKDTRTGGTKLEEVPLSTIMIRADRNGLRRKDLLSCFSEGAAMDPIRWKENIYGLLQSALDRGCRVKRFPLATVKVTEQSAIDLLTARSKKNEASIARNFQAAEAHFKAGEFSKALPFYCRVTEAVPAIVQNRIYWSLHPSVSLSYLMRALCHHMLQEHRQAVSLATFFINMDGPCFEAFDIIAQSMKRFGWPSASEALRNSPEYKKASKKFEFWLFHGSHSTDKVTEITSGEEAMGAGNQIKPINHK